MLGKTTEADKAKSSEPNKLKWPRNKLYVSQIKAKSIVAYMRQHCRQTFKANRKQTNSSTIPVMFL